MIYRPAFGIGFQVAFGDIGSLRRAIDQHMVPRCVAGRFGMGDVAIPVVRTQETGIDIDDHPAITEQAVMNQLTDAELCFRHIQHGAFLSTALPYDRVGNDYTEYPALINENPRSGGQLVADALQVHGVDTAFCVPGESYLEILDALYDMRDTIAVVTTRHENGAANMAEAYGKLTGRVGICMVTRGPGACNAAIGIHTAFQDSTPMIMLVGQVARQHLGREAFQEVDYEIMFKPLAKAVWQVNSAAAVPDIMARAFQCALSGRPGPVVLAFPEDMLREIDVVDNVPPLPVEHAAPSPGDMERLHHILGDAERPLMMLGGGGWNAQAKADIQAFAEANDIPVCVSFRRNDLFDNNHRCYAGEIAIAPNPTLVQRIGEADVLLVVGARLGEMTTQGYTLLDEPKPKQDLVHVHADAQELGRVYQPVLGICSGMENFAAAAVSLSPKTSAARTQKMSDAHDDYLQGRIPNPYEGDLDLGKVMAVLEAVLPDDAIVTVDAGNSSGWAQRFLSFGKGRRLLGPTSGAMGYGVPAVIAAKIVDPGRMAICCLGDGGFGMTGQEIATAVKEGIAPIILVFNNGMYGTIRMHQERRHPDRVIATDLINPDYAALAQANGAFGETVKITEEFAPAFEKALKSGLPALLDLQMDADVITTRTTLHAIKQAHQKDAGDS